MNGVALELREWIPLLAWISLALAAFPAALFLANLPLYRRLPMNLASVAAVCHRRPLGSSPVSRSLVTRWLPKAPAIRRPGRSDEPSLSVLIPARNEEAAIVPALQAILADPDPRLEVLVLDDHSTDATAARIQQVAANDPRVRLVPGRRLPDGWCGKQHACWQLAQSARGDLLVFIDADVRLAPTAIPRIARYFHTRPDVHLVSGVPRQITGTFLEKLLIPLIHTILLGYLPMFAARLTRWSAFAAGCGQLFVARRDAYFASRGHEAIRSSLHDGVQLPRSFRRHGFQTDLIDATDLAQCRMYDSAATVWRGLGKNATEGMAHPAAIVPWTLLLLGGHVLPWLLLMIGPPASASTGVPVPIPTAAALAAGLGLLARLMACLRFHQSLLGALLHPLGITALVLIQWVALVRRWRGRPMEWRGRQYAHPASVPADSQPIA